MDLPVLSTHHTFATSPGPSPGEREADIANWSAVAWQLRVVPFGQLEGVPVIPLKLCGKLPKNMSPVQDGAGDSMVEAVYDGGVWFLEYSCACDLASPIKSLILRLL